MGTRTNRKIWPLIVVFVLVTAAPTFAGQIFYVDDDAPGANDGSSWDNAYNYLQDALTAASSGDEIRVAQGIYKPDEGAGITPGDRSATFQLQNGVTLKGGYAGFGAADPDASDTGKYETILSGDLNGDDGPNFANNGENNYHVVTGYQTDFMDETTDVLDGFIVTGGNADSSSYPDNRGGGMYCNSDATVSNCTFTGNFAICGGGMYCGPSWCCVTYTTLTNCTFIGNSAGDEGGGLWVGDSDPTLTNCRIIGNSAGKRGGGVMFGGDNVTTMLNCILSGNSAGEDGGAIYGVFCFRWTMTNCTLTGNSAEARGGGIYNQDGSDMTLTNCILWGDSPEEISGEWTAWVTVNHSCIQGGWSGDDNIDTDPLFVDADGADNVAGTEDDNLRLLRRSPCIDAGDNSAVPPSMLTDLDGNPRIANHIVDMGAYERQNFVLSTYSVIVPEGGTASFTGALVDDPLGTIQVTVAVESGDPDITVESGATLTFDSSNYAEPQTVILAAAEDGDYLNGTAEIWVSGSGLLTTVVSAREADNEPVPTVLYVDVGASGAGDGWSWDDAFTKLQDALVVAAAYSQVKEVRVAQGIYKPAGPFSGDREATFQLISGVAVKGGYAGLGAPDPDARDVEAYETILSGDLNGDDGPNFANNAENSCHVVSSREVDATAVLEGFTITAGNGSAGGGMYNVYGSPTVVNCTFTGNFASYGGGGMWNPGASPTLSDCTFIGNVASWGGGIAGGDGMTLNNCTFIGNSATSRYGEGGAIFRGEPTLTNCAFIANSAFSGGALNCMYPTVTNCAFIGNSGTFGGALYTLSPPVTNCVFSGNSATRYGGGIRGKSPTVTNCTFSGNSAIRSGGGISTHLDGTPIVTNCIFWGNRLDSSMDESAQIYMETGNPVVNYSCIQGWTGNWGGTGNIGDDPLFADADGPDNVVGTEDDNLRLRDISSCIDTGDPDYVSDPDETDLDGKPRVSGGRIDMGVYEYSPPVSAAIRITPSTLNLASKGKWITCYIWLPEDYNVADIEPNSVFFEREIAPQQFWLTEEEHVAIAKFSRELVQAILDIGEIELTIIGQLTDGTIFEATDVIRVIDKASGKAAK